MRIIVSYMALTYPTFVCHSRISFRSAFDAVWIQMREDKGPVINKGENSLGDDSTQRRSIVSNEPGDVLLCTIIIAMNTSNTLFFD